MGISYKSVLETEVSVSQYEFTYVLVGSGIFTSIPGIDYFPDYRQRKTLVNMFENGQYQSILLNKQMTKEIPMLYA